MPVNGLAEDSATMTDYWLQSFVSFLLAFKTPEQDPKLTRD